MNREGMEAYKKALINEKKRVQEILNTIKENGVASNVEAASEISFCDNHPSDLATELFDFEKGLALKKNEETIMNKIDSSLTNINEGNYGTCKLCGKEIGKERLGFIPYAEYCIDCENHLNDMKPSSKNDKPVEEEVLGSPFGYGYNDFGDAVGFDAEDSYQAVDRYNYMENLEEYDDIVDENQGFVEPIEMISNEQYKDTLPD